jgi:hypothetical protein
MDMLTTRYSQNLTKGSTNGMPPGLVRRANLSSI